MGRHGAETSGWSVLDVAYGMGLRAVEKVRFASGTDSYIAMVCGKTSGLLIGRPLSWLNCLGNPARER
jgi:hypothetical protein